MKKIPIGVSDFKKVITEGYAFVDKTLLIKALLDEGTEVTLFTRPRRFGKTLNLSMLNYFFSNTEKGTSSLFTDLAISRAGETYMQHQGQYPVIFLSLKDIKTQNVHSAQIYIADLLAHLYKQHLPVVENHNLTIQDKNYFNKILNQEASLDEMAFALKHLSTFLYQFYNKKAIILIDEYDTPIQEAYLHGYYEEMMSFMRTFLASALKDNVALQTAVITGILRIAKESIFSGLNHLKVHSVLDIVFGEYFGFTQVETDNLFKAAGLAHEMMDIEAWYNGYQIAGVTIYNPWSILNCIDKKGLKQPYWVNTASNALIQQLLSKASISVKENIESLLQGQSIQVIIGEYMIFRDLSNDDAALWHLLLFAGYLKVLDKQLTEDYQLLCRLAIPNKEVSGVYHQIIKTWFQGAISDAKYDELLLSLIQGRIPAFSLLFAQLIRESLSFFDISGKEPERVYHAFVLGLIARLRNTHIIKSNRESGYGRYDIMIIPKDHTQLGIIMEFKTQFTEKTLEETAQAAMQQINDKQYDTELKQLGINHILKIAIGFVGKEVFILTQ